MWLCPGAPEQLCKGYCTTLGLIIPKKLTNIPKFNTQ